ncbi:hypothetical protein GQ457_13G015590 [Hibiscus cannabinus]
MVYVDLFQDVEELFKLIVLLLFLQPLWKSASASAGVSVAGGGLTFVPSWLFFRIFPLLQFGQEYCRKNLAGQVLALYFPSWMWDAGSHSGRVVRLLHPLGQAVPAHLLAADRCSY